MTILDPFHNPVLGRKRIFWHVLISIFDRWKMKDRFSWQEGQEAKMMSKVNRRRGELKMRTKEEVVFQSLRMPKSFGKIWVVLKRTNSFVVIVERADSSCNLLHGCWFLGSRLLGCFLCCRFLDGLLGSRLFGCFLCCRFLGSRLLGRGLQKSYPFINFKMKGHISFGLPTHICLFL